MRAQFINRNIVVLLIVLLLFSIINAAESKKNYSPQRATVLIGIPTDASTSPKEKNDWFSGFAEEFLHLRLGSSKNVELVKSEDIHRSLKKKQGHVSTKDYLSLARKFDATHLIQQNYEISRDGKVVHYYAEVTNIKGAKKFDTFERDFTIDQLALTLDSCVFWFFRTTKVPLNTKKLSRFFNMRTISSDIKELKTIGKIINRKYKSTPQEIVTSTQALLRIVENDPKNILAHYVAAKFYEYSKEYDKASNEYKNLIMILPNYAALYSDVCRNYRHNNRYMEALSYAANAEKKGVITRLLMLEGALSFEAMGKYNKAHKAFNVILRQDKTEQAALLFFARNSNRVKKYSDAISFSDKVIALNPNSGAAYLEKGFALKQLKKYDEAKETLKKSASTIGDASRPTRLIGDIHFIKKEYAKAALFYDAALKNNNSDYNLFIKTADSWKKAKDMSKVVKLLQQAENQFPDSLELQKLLGLAFYKNKKYTDANYHLEKYLDKGKKDANVFMALGNIYTATKKYDKAFYMYHHSMNMVTDKTKGTFALALLYLKKGDTGATISYLKEILKSQPDYPNAHKYLGDAWYAEKNYKKALLDYKRARFLNKNDSYIQKKIAAIYFKRKEYNAANREFLLYNTLYPKDMDSYYSLSIANLHLNKIVKAEEYLNIAQSLGRPSSEILFLFGDGYLSLKMNKKAIEFFIQCITLDPKYTEALIILAEIYLEENNKSAAAKVYLDLYTVDNSKYSRFLGKAGLLYEDVNDMEKAYKLYLQFFENDYDNSNINIHLARMNYSKKKYPGVIATLEKIPELEIVKISDKLLFADSYIILGKTIKAIPWLKNIIKKNIENIIALSMLAASYESVSDYNNALLIYKKLLTLDYKKNGKKYSYKIALMYEKAKNMDEAIIAYKKNIKDFPNYIQNYSHLLAINNALENWGGVRAVLEKCVKIPNVKPFYWKQLAEVCLKQNDKASAVKNFKSYLKKNTLDDDAWFQLGMLYFDRGLFDKSLIYFKKAIKIKPDDFNIIFQTALAFTNVNDHVIAEKLFSKALLLDSNNVEVLIYLSLNYRTTGKNEKLPAILNKIVRLQPGNYAVKVEYGYSLLGLGKKAEAISVLEQACKMNPEDAETHIILSGIYASQGNTNARFSHLKQALVHNKNNADVQSMVGQFYIDKKEFETALPYIKKALDLNSDHLGAYYSYSVCLYNDQDYDNALTAIKNALKGDSFNSLYLLIFAKINFALGKINLAMKTIDNALTIDSSNADILSYAGFVYKENDRVEDAKKMLVKAITLSDNCSDCYNYLGEIYFEETLCAKAAGFFRQTLDIIGYDEEVLLKLGRTLVLSYQNENAKEIFSKIFSKNPEHHESFYRLAHIYLQQKNFRAVEELIDKRKNNKKTAWDHLVIGEKNELMGNREAALISYTVVLRLKKDMPEAFDGKGRIDLLDGKFNDAIINFSKALVADPYNPYLLLNLGKAYEGIGQFSSAFDIYSEVADKYLQIPDSYCYIAGIKSRKKHHTGAIEIIQKGLKYNPKNAELHSLLGREYALSSDFEKAINAYKIAGKNGGDSYVEVYLKIANIYKNIMKNGKEAKKYIKKYLKNGGDKNKIKTYNLAQIGM